MKPIHVLACLLLSAVNFAYAGEIATPSPQAVVQKQLDAYNALDIDAFVALYAEDVEVYDYPATLRYKGRDKLRERYAALFAQAPELHAELLDRLVAGNTVIDSERVTDGGPQALEAVAVYRVEDGLITSVMFLPVN